MDTGDTLTFDATDERNTVWPVADSKAVQPNRIGYPALGDRPRQRRGHAKTQKLNSKPRSSGSGRRARGVIRIR
jgi:hypothetical protein